MAREVQAFCQGFVKRMQEIDNMNKQLQIASKTPQKLPTKQKEADKLKQTPNENTTVSPASPLQIVKSSAQNDLNAVNKIEKINLPKSPKKDDSNTQKIVESIMTPKTASKTTKPKLKSPTTAKKSPAVTKVLPIASKKSPSQSTLTQSVENKQPTNALPKSEQKQLPESKIPLSSSSDTPKIAHVLKKDQKNSPASKKRSLPPVTDALQTKIVKISENESTNKPASPEAIPIASENVTTEEIPASVMLEEGTNCYSMDKLRENVRSKAGIVFNWISY